jgi:hypothetical protein
MIFFFCCFIKHGKEYEACLKTSSLQPLFAVVVRQAAKQRVKEIERGERERERERETGKRERERERGRPLPAIS